MATTIKRMLSKEFEGYHARTKAARLAQKLISSRRPVWEHVTVDNLTPTCTVLMAYGTPWMQAKMTAEARTKYEMADRSIRRKIFHAEELAGPWKTAAATVLEMREEKEAEPVESSPVECEEGT